ncbi:septation protein SepH [Zhihengliuella sp.]|uniref:septation protein SepH n=1 Tax=Zhihengliuella sp. TaxID=1954483 RepID=UPI0028115B41|nr:septation protein SepH [Zhihengliuella sp.]
MQQLRLVGVHDDGSHVLLASEGETFQLAIDDALRQAVTRPSARPGGDQAADPSAASRTLSPREIQARIRSGASADELVRESGLPLENIMRYASPVLAEREYMAQQAQRVEVSGPQGHDAYRSAFGDEPANLAEMVRVRLEGFGVDVETLAWDAARRSDGAWNVTAEFASPSDADRLSIGDEPVARWIFHPSRKLLQNSNRWAQVLSELEPLDSPFAGRRLTAVADHPFDVEAAEDEEKPASPADETQESRAQDEFLEILRARRGQRLGEDEDGDDELALMLSQGVPAAHPRDEDFADEAEARRLGFAEEDQELPHLHDGVSTETSDVTVVPNLRTLRFAAREDDASADSPSAGRKLPTGRNRAGEDERNAAGAQDDPQGKRQKPKRSSVPSWDEIVFGKKQD